MLGDAFATNLRYAGLKIIAILLFSHVKYITNNSLPTAEIFSATINNIEVSFDNASLVKNTGGGIIGAFFAWANVSLFTIEGTRVVCIALIIFGIV